MQEENFWKSTLEGKDILSTLPKTEAKGQGDACIIWLSTWLLLVFISTKTQKMR